jgi:hypothetical protein
LSDTDFAGYSMTAIWRIKHHFNFIFEIPTRDIAHLLPTRLRPIEPSIGLSLLNVGYMRLHAGQLGNLPEFDEITFSIQVGADLSLDIPMPRFAVYDLRIGSNSEAFLSFENDHQELNGYYSKSLTAIVNSTQDEVSVEDDDGRIFVLRNTNPELTLKTELALGQYYSKRPDGLYQGIFRWEGGGFEHQHGGDAGCLFAHPFFQEIDVARVSGCYTQMLLAPDSEARLHSYRPRRLTGS